MKKNIEPVGQVAAGPSSLGYRMPAEWEPHAATWLAWPHAMSDWPGKFEAVPWVFVEMARALQEGERIHWIVQNAREEGQVKKQLHHSGVDTARVTFWRYPTDRSWTRDFMPLLVVKGEKRKRQLAAVKFKFNGWARYKNHKQDELAGQNIAEDLGIPAFYPKQSAAGSASPFVLEGGAIDVDGEGTLLATEQCLLNGKQARNPQLSAGETERVLAETLGVHKVLWLGSGIAGDDTGGHIDDFARFVGPGKMVLAQEKNVKDPNYQPLVEARERLKYARDAKGRRVEVVPLPMPAPVVFAGQRLPASYANFYIGNARVLVPTFNDPQDRIALGILAELFPDREVVGIYARDLVLGLGTVHCSTQQHPQ